MERAITKPDPDSPDMALSQREHLVPIEWEKLLLCGQHLIDRSRIRTAWRVTSQHFARYPNQLETEERTLTSDVTNQREQLLAFP